MEKSKDQIDSRGLISLVCSLLFWLELCRIFLWKAHKNSKLSYLLNLEGDEGEKTAAVTMAGQEEGSGKLDKRQMGKAQTYTRPTSYGWISVQKPSELERCWHINSSNLLFYFAFLWITSNIKEAWKNSNKNSHTLYTQIHQLSAFWHISYSVLSPHASFSITYWL